MTNDHNTKENERQIEKKKKRERERDNTSEGKHKVKKGALKHGTKTENK